MKSVSTHVLDITQGRPAAGIAVRLEKKTEQGYSVLHDAMTDADGRVKELVPEGQLEVGVYRITFDTAAYFPEGFYPEASIVFQVREAGAHYHVPLLLSPFGYSTYRGS